MIVQLKHGSRKLDINDGTTYKMGMGFAPPSATYDVNFAAGTSANRTGGAEVISKRANDRTWSFEVMVMGDSATETHQAISRLRSMLNLSDDKSNKLYLEYRADDAFTYEPMWGQGGAFLRYHIKHAVVTIAPLYGLGDLREKEIFCQVGLTIAPFAEGKRQRVGTAKGGICEDWIGTEDGISRGVQVPEASNGSGNEFLNPVFGSSTYNANWDDDANVTDTENTDPEFLLFGSSSVKLFATADDQYTDTLTLDNATDFYLSFYVKKPDSSAVTTADVDVHYDGSDETTTYTSVGNGWYRIHAGITGDGAAGKVGITVKADRVIYMDAAQCEEVAYLTPFFYGDMLGCAWGGTAHASASTRTAAYLRFPGDEVFSQEWTARIIWKADKASTAITTDIIFLEDEDSNLKLHYDNANNRFEFTDGTNTGTYSKAYSAGDIIVMHLTTGFSGSREMKFYYNSTYAAFCSWTPIATFDYLYLGSDNAGANQTNGTFLGFATFEREMSATEISDDYDMINEWVSLDSTGKRYESIPYLWTKDGDDVVDNCNDSTRDNSCVVGGIPGTAPADTTFSLTIPGGSTIDQLALSNWVLPVSDYVDPSANLFLDFSGTVDANSSGGQYELNEVSTTDELINTAGNISERATKYFIDNEFIPFIRLKDEASATLHISPAIFPKDNPGGASTVIYGEESSIAVDTTFYLYSLSPVPHLSSKRTLSDILKNDDLTIDFYVYGRHASGTTDVMIDYANLMPRPVIVLDTENSGAIVQIILSGNRAASHISESLYDYVNTKGDIVELIPDRLNVLQTLSGRPTTDPLITWTTTFTKVLVTPRYEVI